MRSPIMTSPAVTSSSPATMRRSVDLPQPDGPTSTMNSPSPISMVTSLTARTSLSKALLTLSKTMRATSRLPSRWIARLESCGCQALADARAGTGRGLQPVAGQQRRSDDGRHTQPRHARRRHHGVNPVDDAPGKTAVAAGKHATTERDVDVAAREMQAAHGRDDHGDKLVGLPVDDALSGGVALPGGHEHHRRELSRILPDATGLDGLQHGRHAAQAVQTGRIRE